MSPSRTRLPSVLRRSGSRDTWDQVDPTQGLQQRLLLISRLQRVKDTQGSTLGDREREREGQSKDDPSGLAVTRRADLGLQFFKVTQWSPRRPYEKLLRRTWNKRTGWEGRGVQWMWSNGTPRCLGERAVSTSWSARRLGYILYRYIYVYIPRKPRLSQTTVIYIV